MYKVAGHFIKEFQGQSGSNTANILKAAAGKVLIIDEAPGLSANGDYGRQVLNTLVAKLDEGCGQDIAVVMCGNKKEMDDMMKRTPGLSSRFSQKFIIEGYNDDQVRDTLTAAMFMKCL